MQRILVGGKMHKKLVLFAKQKVLESFERKRTYNYFTIN